MKHFTPFLLFICLLCNTSCINEDKPSDPCDPPCTSTPTFESKILWHQPINEDTSEVYLRWIKSADNIVVYVILKDTYEKCVVARDVKTGKLLWEWGEPEVVTAEAINSLDIKDGKVIIGVWADLFIVDLHSGNTIWKALVSSTGLCGSPRITLINDDIYFVSQDCANPSMYSRISRTPITHYAPEVVCQVNMTTNPGVDSGWIAGLEPPALWLNAQGDSVLIFQDRAFKLGNTQSKVDMYAYNLKSKNIEWKIDSVAKEGFSSVQTPIIKDDFIYYAGMYTLFKISAKNGDIVWSTPFPADFELFAFCRILLTDQHIFAHPSSKKFYALNPSTGEIDWTINDIACCGMSGEFSLIGGKLYYVSAPYFVVIDSEKGVLVSKDKSPYKFPNGQIAEFTTYTKATSSPENKVVLTSDNCYLMAIKTE